MQRTMRVRRRSTRPGLAVLVVGVVAVVALLAVLAIPRLGGAARTATPDYWPTVGWRTSTPEAQGFDSDQIADALLAWREQDVRLHSVLMIRNGYVVADATFYPYDGETIHDVASVTKSVMTTLIGIAADQGKLDLDDPMVSFFPGRTIANLDARKEQITVRHLAGMSSGLECIRDGVPGNSNDAMQASADYVQFGLDLPVASEPGSQFVYCSPAIHLLSPILQQATGMTTLEFARQNLFEPLGIENVMWEQDPQGYYDGWGDLSLHPHDMAKLGLLFLQKGRWEGERIVSRQWVEAATVAQTATPEGEDPYGYGWWLAPDVEGVYRADGRNGQYIYVLPAWNMILVTTGGGFDIDEIAEPILAILAELGEPLPANPEGVARLGAAVQAVAQPPEPQPAAALPETATLISGRTYVFPPNPAELQSLTLTFDDPAEAVVSLETSGGPMLDMPVGLDGVYRFSAGPDGRPAGFRGAWVDAQTLVLEYDGITNNDRTVLELRFEGDRVQATASEAVGMPGVGFEGEAQ